MFTFCPMCQLPLQAIKISPEIHVNKCLREWDGSNLKECPEGAKCLSTDFYHYIDYSHKELAEYRSSAEFVEPKVEFTNTPEKRNSPKKSFQSPVILRHCDEDSANKKEDNSDDSDSDIFRPTKRIKRGLSFEDHGKSNSIKSNKNSKLASKFRKSLKSTSSRLCCKSNTNQSQISSNKKEQFENQPQSSFSVSSASTVNSGMKTTSETVFSTFIMPTSVLSTRCENVELDVRVKSNSDNVINSEVVSENHDRNTEEHNVNSVVKKLSVNNETVVDKESENANKNNGNECENSNKKIIKKNKTDFKNSKTTNRGCNNSLLNSTETFSCATVSALTKEIVTLYNTERNSKKKFSVNTEQTHCEEHSKNISNSCTDVQHSVLNEISDNKINKDVSTVSSAVCNENRFITSSSCNSTVTSVSSWLQRKESVSINNNNNKTESNLFHSTVTSSTVTVNSYNDETQQSNRKPTRKCPFYKRIPDTCFAVDAFQYGNIPGVRIYFLSHFHADHYGGLTKKFSNPIYCSQITDIRVAKVRNHGFPKPYDMVRGDGQKNVYKLAVALRTSLDYDVESNIHIMHWSNLSMATVTNLVRMKFGVDEKWINVIEVGQTQVIHTTEVTALDANHCPGSVMFLFRLRNGRNYLHVGDFRADPKMHKYAELQNIHIEALFLDTTYCNPRYTFQSQEEVVKSCISFAQKHISNHPKTLFVCGTYTIGKEKVFLGIAEALDCKIWAKPEKRKVFACLNDVRINRRLTTKNTEAKVHVVSMNDIDFEDLSKHLKSFNGVFTHIAAFRPSGWESTSKNKNFNINVVDSITIYGVPYSEHSNFLELQSFVQFIQPTEVIQTVNVGNTKNRDQVKKYVDEWLRQPSNSGNKMVQSKMSAFFETKS